MDMGILALSDRMDLSGVLCLASILWIIILLAAYSKGWIAGGFTCFILFCCTLFINGDSRSAGGGSAFTSHNFESHMIANKSQTKWLKQGTYDIDDINCIFTVPNDYGGGPHDDWYFIPTEEMYSSETGTKFMKATGKKPHRYDLVGPEVLKNRDWSKPNSWVYGDWGHPDGYLYKDKHGEIVKVNTGRPPTDDDYYIYNKVIDNMHTPKSAGGGGIPQWVYHPASSTYIFGFGALPVIIGGMLLTRKLI